MRKIEAYPPSDEVGVVLGLSVGLAYVAMFLTGQLWVGPVVVALVAVPLAFLHVARGRWNR